MSLISLRYIVSYIKASWLAGNRQEDCNAELIRYIVSKHGIVSESLVVKTTANVYLILDIELNKSNNLYGG